MYTILKSYNKQLFSIALLMFCLYSCSPGEGNTSGAKAPAGSSETEAATSVSDNSSATQAASSLPTAKGWVNDFGMVLNDESRAELKDKIDAYESRTGRQIAVTTVKNIGSYSKPHAYATALSSKWGVGQRGENNGVMILLCTECQKVVIATGKGAEDGLTDEMCQDIIDNVMIPMFKDRKTAPALIAGLEAIIERWN